MLPHHGSWLSSCCLLLLCVPGSLGTDVSQMSKDMSTETLKESIKALYMNMDVPEVSPADHGSGTLNVSVSVSEVVRLDNNEIDLSFTLDLRWGHRFLDVMSDALEAIPLSREKLWTPKFVFLNVRSVREEQSSLFLQLSGSGTSKAIVYKVWQRASVKCDGPSLQYPIGDTLCTMIFEEANPRSQRSVHLALSRHHQHNCSFYDTGRNSIVYRLSKPFSSDGRKYQFLTRICIKSNLDDMSRALRQYCLSLMLVLYSLTTLYFFDRTTRLLINLALLHILLFNWSPPIGGVGSARLNAVDVWLAKCALVICCCLLVAMATAEDAGSRHRRKEQQKEQLQLQQREDQMSGRQSVKCGSGSYSGTFLMQPQATSSAGLRNSKCTTISECSDHLDLFPSDPAVQHHLRRRRNSANPGLGGCGAWKLVAKSLLPGCWLLLAAAFWACLLITAPRCDTLLPECHQR